MVLQGKADTPTTAGAALSDPAIQLSPARPLDQRQRSFGTSADAGLSGENGDGSGAGDGHALGTERSSGKRKRPYGVSCLVSSPDSDSSTRSG